MSFMGSIVESLRVYQSFDEWFHKWALYRAHTSTGNSMRYVTGRSAPNSVGSQGFFPKEHTSNFQRGPNPVACEGVRLFDYSYGNESKND